MRCLLPIVAAVLPSLQAQAHAILVDSAPALQATVVAGQVPVRLAFNSRIDASRSRLTLRVGAKDLVLTLDPGTPPNVLAGTIALVPGVYTIRWQVLAIDGHITRGDVPFTVVGP